MPRPVTSFFARTLASLLLLAPLGCHSVLAVQPNNTSFALLFTNTTIPLDVNASGLELTGESGTRNTNHWSYAVTVEWDGRGIGQIAREQGFERVDFADLEVFQLLGVWTERTVCIYGTRKESSTEEPAVVSSTFDDDD